jgi:hypothetical protein
MRYVVHRAGEPVAINAKWDKPVWRDVPALELTQYMGERPEHFPKTQAKLLYDDDALYVIFRVADQYVRATAKKHQDMVCQDSCVEFFFTPGVDVSKGYFNLEMNCGGTMWFRFQVIPRKDSVKVSPAVVKGMDVATTLPKIVDPEIAEPTTWVVEYRLPFAFVKDYYSGATLPAPGVQWRANFFKCADATSKPHWLTWSRVNRPKPDFHVPEDFGTLEFE